MRIGLVGCVKDKAQVARPARDLYVSPLFRGRRAYVERTCDRWFILSALHGLVDPSQLLEPYDKTLAETPSTLRREWSRRVLAALEHASGELGSHTFEIHAGAAYRGYGLVDGLRARRAVVEIPTAGLSIGHQLAFYARGAGLASEGPRIAPAQGLGALASRGQPLRDYLEHASPPVTLSFADVERILGRPLPPSARKHRAWWANSPSQTLARQWLAAGWKAEMVDLFAEQVRLNR